MSENGVKIFQGNPVAVEKEMNAWFEEMDPEMGPESKLKIHGDEKWPHSHTAFNVEHVSSSSSLYKSQTLQHPLVVSTVVVTFTIS